MEDCHHVIRASSGRHPVIDQGSAVHPIVGVAAHDDLDGLVTDLPDGHANVLRLFVVVACAVDDQAMFGLGDRSIGGGAGADHPHAIPYLVDGGFEVHSCGRRLQCLDIGDRAIWRCHQLCGSAQISRNRSIPLLCEPCANQRGEWPPCAGRDTPTCAR